MSTVEEIAREALRAYERELRVAEDPGDELAIAIRRRSALGGWFPGVDWELVDHNYPECRQYDAARGLVVVRPSRGDIRPYFILTVSDPRRPDSPSQVWIAGDQAVEAWEAGGVPNWMMKAAAIDGTVSVGRWLRDIKARAERPVAA